VFTVILCGFAPRCSLEIDDGSEVRIDKIARIIGECRLGVHDLSRTELDPASGLPRFNMPFELGLFLGAKRFGGEAHSKKNCLILDLEPYRYQKFISDLAGQDIRAHGGQVSRIVAAVRDWLRTTSGRKDIPGGGDIAARFAEFMSKLPDLCARIALNEAEITYADYYGIAATWLDERIAGQERS
jgi:hypothetical protein